MPVPSTIGPATIQKLATEIASLLINEAESGDAITGITASPLTAASDPAGRLRVSEPTIFGEYAFQWDKAPLLWDEEVSGASETSTFVENKVVMTVTDPNDFVMRKTRQPHPYRKGFGQTVELTMSRFEVQSEVVKIAAYVTSNNTPPFLGMFDGFGLFSDGTTGEGIKIVISKAGTETVIVQDDWDINKTESPLIVDWSKFNIVMFDFLWLGGSSLRLFIHNGTEFVLAHTERFAGIISEPFIVSPANPVRYGIIKTGAGVTGEFHQICSQVSSDGGSGSPRLTRAVDTAGTSIAAASNSVWYALKGVRMKSTTPTACLEIIKISVLSATNDEYIWRLYRNPVWATNDPSASFVDVADFQFQECIGNPGGLVSTVAASGEYIEGGTGAGNTSFTVPTDAFPRFGIQLDGTPDEYWVVVEPNGNAAVFDCSIVVGQFL